MKRLLIDDSYCTYEDGDKEYVACMSKLLSSKADKSVVGDIPKFIYFSTKNSSHGPKIKFYGGSKETGVDTRTCPSYTFSIKGPGHVKLQKWMNRSNCPLAYDENTLDMLYTFVDRQLPILLLVWYGKLDEDDALDYFKGAISWNTLINKIDTSQLDDLQRTQLRSSSSVISLHQNCINFELYK
jgi:hypothetical protein